MSHYLIKKYIKIYLNKKLVPESKIELITNGDVLMKKD